MLTSDLSVSFRRLHLHKKRSEVKQPFVQMAGVSLLKPLKGVDPNLISNLETFFTLDYPKVTITTGLIDRLVPFSFQATALSNSLNLICLLFFQCFCFQYEVLLCVQDQDDPAVDVCKKLLGKYPNVDARLFIGELLQFLSCLLFVLSLDLLYNNFAVYLVVFFCNNQLSFNDMFLTFLNRLLAANVSMCLSLISQGGRKLESTPRLTT